MNYPDTIESIIGYTHYLLMKAQKAGNMMLDGHKPSSEEKEIAQSLRKLCERLEKRLSVCKERELADILDCYDMAYTVGYNRFPDSEMVMRLKQRVMKIRKSEIRDWLATLLKHNTLPGITSYEKYRRLSLVMKENLDSYIKESREQFKDFQELVEDSQELKQRWYEANKVDDLTSLSTVILRAYRQFITSLPAAIIGFTEKMALDNRIVRELATRTDLDPYDREAFRLLLNETYV